MIPHDHLLPPRDLQGHPTTTHYPLTSPCDPRQYPTTSYCHRMSQHDTS